MTAISSPARRPGLRVAAALLAITLPTSALPLEAFAADVTPASAAAARKAPQEKAKKLLGSDPEAAGDQLAAEAKKTKDPVLYIDAAEAYRAAGAADKDKAALEQGIELARVALDILHYQQDPRCDPDWQHVDSGEISGEIARAEKAIEDSEKALADLDKPAEEAPPPAEEDDDAKKKRKKAPRDGRGLIAGGALLTAVGVGGLAMIGAGVALGSSAQKEVNGLNPADIDYQSRVDELDAKGKTANTVAFAGIGVAVVGLAAGVALLAVGLKKRKKYKAEHGSGGDESARVQVAPALGHGYGGLVLGGRF